MRVVSQRFSASPSASAAGVSRVEKTRSRFTKSRKSAYHSRSWSARFSSALPRSSKKSIVARRMRRDSSSRSAGSNVLGLKSSEVFGGACCRFHGRHHPIIPPSTDCAALKPFIPWTPAPGGVAAEQMKSPSAPQL